MESRLTSGMRKVRIFPPHGFGSNRNVRKILMFIKSNLLPTKASKAATGHGYPNSGKVQLILQSHLLRCQERKMWPWTYWNSEHQL